MRAFVSASFTRATAAARSLWREAADGFDEFEEENERDEEDEDEDDAVTAMEPKRRQGGEGGWVEVEDKGEGPRVSVCVRASVSAGLDMAMDMVIIGLIIIKK